MGTIALIPTGKGVAIPAALKPTPLAPGRRPFRPFSGSYLWPCYARRYLPAAIGNNCLYVKTSADIIITNLEDSMHVNTNQSKPFVGASILFMFSETIFSFMFTGIMSFGNPPIEHTK